MTAPPFLQLPARYTPPRSDASDGPRLVRFTERHWVNAETGQLLVLDQWQRWLLDHVLELDEHGQLRYRQVLVSMARQNGKSVLGALLGLYGLLLHVRAPVVFGVASSVDQSRIVYDRTRAAIDASPTLAALVKTTGTRGLRRRDGTGSYSLVRSMKADAIQGLPISLGIFDELHIAKAELWDALVNGQRSRAGALLVGITTAGDENSELLHRLYRRADAAIDDPDSDPAFGAFIYEAPNDETSIDDDAGMYAANPALAAGRIPLERVRADVRLAPRADQLRYVLNRFTAGSSTSWLPAHLWRATAGAGLPASYTGPLTVGVDTSLGLDSAYLVAVATIDGIAHSSPVASLAEPTIDSIVDAVRHIARRGPARVALDGYARQKPLVDALRDAGVEVRAVTQGEVAAACARVYALLAQGAVDHGIDPTGILDAQATRAGRKTLPDGSWRIVRPARAPFQIDALLAFVWAHYVEDVEPYAAPSLFVRRPTAAAS